jgi:hypothetical protein
MTVRPSIEHPEFETFELSVSRRKRHGHYAFLLNLPNGAHFHFRDIKEHNIRSAIQRLNCLQQKTDPTFYLSVRTVSDRDPKGRGFRVIRQDREVKP